ncbi:MAG: peptidyl-prolyl cis-trans isomerase, partial [Acidobacteriia bacterium]|nr:peptidyl-prolyl cis-trans isomerase [Terriglobia bacterium]
MFDLFRSRQKAVRYTLTAILGVIALSMVVTLIPGFGSNTPRIDDGSILAEIGSKKITAQEAAQRAQRVMRGNQLPPEMIDVYMPQFIDGMIQQEALVYEFERLGLKVSDEEVLDSMKIEYQQFFQNGAFTGKAQMEAMLAQEGMTLQDAIDLTRNGVLYDKIQNLAYNSAVVTPKEIDDELRRRFERSKIEYVAFPPAKFKDQAKASPEEMKAYYDSHKFQYSTPEKRSFQVIVIDQDKVEKSINVTDAQLRAAYAANMDNFRNPERVHARHILIKTVDKSDAEKKQLLAKAQDTLKQVKGGGNFAEIAKKSSEDTGSAEKGGDLGWVVRGQMLPEFEKAVFSLKPGEIGDLVTTSVGYHIVQVLEREPARVKPFDEVKAALLDDLRKQQVNDKMQSTADQAHAALEKSPGSAAQIAAQFGVDVVTVTNAAPGEAIPTLGVSPEIDGALNGLQKNGVSPVLVLPANRMAVVVVNDKVASHPADYAEVQNQVRDAVLDAKTITLTQEKAKEAADKIKAGADLKTVAKSMKLDATESAEFGRNDSVEGLGHAALVPDAFSKPAGTVIGPVPVQG